MTTVKLMQARLRKQLCDESPIDLDKHARLIAETVLKRRGLLSDDVWGEHGPRDKREHD